MVVIPYRKRTEDKIFSSPDFIFYEFSPVLQLLKSVFPYHERRRKFNFTNATLMTIWEYLSHVLVRITSQQKILITLVEFIEGAVIIVMLKPSSQMIIFSP